MSVGCTWKAHARERKHHRASGCAILAALMPMVWVNTASIAGNSATTSGRLLASNCSQCHGTNKTAAGFDTLMGKNADKLYKKLKKYQSGAEGEGIMARHASGYTDPQMRDIAQWLSRQR